MNTELLIVIMSIVALHIAALAGGGLALGIMRLLVMDDRHDAEFVNQHCHFRAPQQVSPTLLGEASRASAPRGLVARLFDELA